MRLFTFDGIFAFICTQRAVLINAVHKAGLIFSLRFYFWSFLPFLLLQNSIDGDSNHGKKEGHEMRLRSSVGIKQRMLQLCTVV